ncbi:MAG: hypothetical protein H0W02_00065 [Ktedonobacteraceae bacterium]|nr:hypothetical protein [Ktedonobacteraceae bacterium]
MENISRRARPLGITILAIILAVFGILALLGVILGFIGASQIGGAAAGALTVALIIAAIFAIAYLVLAWGLWTLRPWAFWATAVVMVLSLLNALFGLVVQHTALSGLLLGLIIPIVVLIYLFADRNVRAAFRT